MSFLADDGSLDEDAAFWELIDSTVARRSSNKLLAHQTPKPLTSPQVSNNALDQRRPTKEEKRLLPFQIADTSLAVSKQLPRIQPQKIARLGEPTSEAIRAKRFERVIETRDSVERSCQAARFQSKEIVAYDPIVSSSHELIERSRGSRLWAEGNENMPLSGNPPVANEWMSGVPSAAMFKHMQNAAMSVLEKGDYTLMQGKPYIKKCGWRKIAFFFNISFEIKDKTIKFDQNNAVQRAEFVVRASMQSGRFSDGWGSCDRGEKKFSKPNHDIPSTAETRAKTRACQDLLGIGEYKIGTGGW